MKFSSRLHPEDSAFNNLMVKMLQLESCNCIIVYKTQRKQVQTRPSMYEDIDAKKDLLVLGIQNKEQLEMFKQGVQKIYYIDSTQYQKI